MLRGLASICVVALLVHVEARPQGGDASGNAGVSNALSEQDWNQIARGQIQQAQVILRRFAPDSWLNAFNAIPQESKLCLVKTQTKAIYEASQLSQQIQPEVIFAQIQRSCPNDWDKILAFFQTMKDTFNQLPESLKQSTSDLLKSLAQVKDQVSSGNEQVVFPIFAQFLRSIAALNDQDKQQIANAFPKFRDAITAPEFNQFFDGTAKLVENEQATQSLMQVMKALNALKARLRSSPDGNNSFDGSS
ncbi:hypothetical protein AAVH_03460 [Aphelenchoides avenae]|nr:hypothetical protein AAVH_03460 [Aphelenchus avenae]